MIDKIDREKGDAQPDRDIHPAAVALPVARPDARISHQENDDRRRIDDRENMRQFVNRDHGSAQWAVASAR